MNRFTLILVVVSLSLGHAAQAKQPARDSLLTRPPVALDGDGLLRLKQAKYNAALSEFKSRSMLWRGGKSTLTDLLSSARRLSESDLANPVTRVLTHLSVAQEIENEIVEKLKAGIVNVADREQVRYYRLELEIQQLKLLEK